MVPNIFHNLSKNAVVHKLKKVFLKLISIFAKNGSSLYFLHSSFKYSASTSKIYPCLYFLISLSIFSGVKPSNFSHSNPKTLAVLGSLPINKGCLHLSIEDAYLSRLDCTGLHKYIVSTGLASYCFSNPTSDTFFKHQQDIYASKPLKPKLV